MQYDKIWTWPTIYECFEFQPELMGHLKEPCSFGSTRTQESVIWEHQYWCSPSSSTSNISLLNFEGHVEESLDKLCTRPLRCIVWVKDSCLSRQSLKRYLLLIKVRNYWGAKGFYKKEFHILIEFCWRRYRNFYHG